MKSALVIAMSTLLAAAPAFAQSNATQQGTITAPSNGAGMPSAQTPAGVLSTTQVGPGSPASPNGQPPVAGTGSTQTPGAPVTTK